MLSLASKLDESLERLLKSSELLKDKKLPDILHCLDLYSDLRRELETLRKAIFLGHVDLEVEEIDTRLEKLSAGRKCVEELLKSERDSKKTDLTDGQSRIFGGSFRYVEEGASERLLPVKAKLTYWNYIKPKELTELQNPRSSHHDEHLFILVHQSFELWFKQVRYEIAEIQKLLSLDLFKQMSFSSMQYTSNLIKVLRYIKRADKILRHTVGAFDILETMDPGDFLDFRDELGDGSGFQSTQFRLLELALGAVGPSIGGVPWEEKFKSFGCPFSQMEQIDAEKKKNSLKSIIEAWLAKLGRDEIPNLDDFINHILETKAELHKKEGKSFDETSARAFFFGGDDSGMLRQSFTTNETTLLARRTTLFLFTWRDHARWSTCANILTGVLYMEQALLVWKHRHPRMVEIMIGRRIGTGGSSGVAYLDATTLPRYRVFSDAIRVRGEALSLALIGRGLNSEGYWDKKK